MLGKLAGLDKNFFVVFREFASSLAGVKQGEAQLHTNTPGYIVREIWLGVYSPKDVDSNRQSSRSGSEPRPALFEKSVPSTEPLLKLARTSTDTSQ